MDRNSGRNIIGKKFVIGINSFLAPENSQNSQIGKKIWGQSKESKFILFILIIGFIGILGFVITSEVTNINVYSVKFLAIFILILGFISYLIYSVLGDYLTRLREVSEITFYNDKIIIKDYKGGEEIPLNRIVFTRVRGMRPGLGGYRFMYNNNRYFVKANAELANYIRSLPQFKRTINPYLIATIVIILIVLYQLYVK